MEEHKDAVTAIAEQALEDALARLRRGECNPEVIAHFLEQVNAESKGYFKEDDFANYDEARRILKIGGRTTMKEYLDRKGVKMRKIGNTPVGFLKSQLYAIASKAKTEKKQFRNDDK
jgi:hypothetical protein